MDVNKTHGGPGRGQGRKKEPGYTVTTKARFLIAEEQERWNSLSPRERVEIVLEWLENQGCKPTPLAADVATRRACNQSGECIAPECQPECEFYTQHR